MGKDAYTGEDIDIEDLFDNSKYDIDHIYPRSLTDDNSLENNLVLVSATINQDVKKMIIRYHMIKLEVIVKYENCGVFLQ